MANDIEAGTAHAEVFEQNRNRLFGVAYGMLGSAADAEDVVQDSYLRWASTELSGVDSPGAYLTTITTRLAIDRLRSARHRRETYIGPWLPEPLVTSYESDPGEIVVEAERLSLAMLTALERLNPTERAVLLLREVFDLDYSEIAAVVDKSSDNCRQIFRRARDRVGDAGRRNAIDPRAEQRLMSEYMAAMAAGDVDALARAFAADVVLWSDGGGVVRAARHLLNGAARVARHLVGVARQSPANVEVMMVRAGGEPGFAGMVDGEPVGMLTFDIRDEVIVGVHALLNPEKLARVKWP